MEKHEITKEEQKQLDLKIRAITAGLVVELEPHEADILGVEGFDEISPDDPEYQDLLDSRFDSCEYNLDECMKEN